MCLRVDLRLHCPHYEILERKPLIHYMEYSFWRRNFKTQQGMSLDETNSVSSGLTVKGTPPTGKQLLLMSWSLVFEISGRVFP